MNTKKIVDYSVIILALTALLLVLCNVLTKDQGIILFLAPIGAILLFAAIARPLIEMYNKKVLRVKEKEIKRYKAEAKEKGLKPLPFSNIHTVYAKNQKEANKIGNDKVIPIIKENPNKICIYISEDCINLISKDSINLPNNQ